MPLSHTLLRQWVSYNPESGIFRWLIDGPRSVGRIGTIATHDHPKGYLCIRLPDDKYLAHRLAFLYMTGEWPKEQVDHIDRNKKNNAWGNLRDISGTQNLYNSRLLWGHNRSGVKGVMFYDDEWWAYIKNHGTQHILGKFATKAEAIRARRSAEVRYYE